MSLLPYLYMFGEIARRFVLSANRFTFRLARFQVTQITFSFNEVTIICNNSKVSFHYNW